MNERKWLPIIPTLNRRVITDSEEHKYKMKLYGGYKPMCRSCPEDCKQYNKKGYTIPHCPMYPNKKLIAQYEQGRNE